MAETKEAVKTPEVVEAPKAAAAMEKYEMPSVIMRADDYDRAYRYLSARYHVLSPVTAFSGMAPQHGLVVAKVQIDSDPDHGEVYQDKLFCKTGRKDPLDDEVAIGKVGLRRLALAGGWNLDADVLLAERNHWVLRGYNRFIGLDGAVQTFSATEEYDLRDGSPQIRSFTKPQTESARAHGLRGAEARALNAACREYGIRQKYTRRELIKSFVIMRMMFIPDPANDLQMRIVTERALNGTRAMYPQATLTQSLEPLEPIEGLKQPVDSGMLLTEAPEAHAPTVVGQSAASQSAASEDVPNLPEGFVLLRKVEVIKKERRDKTGTFNKWTATDHHGESVVTIKHDFGKALMACWNQEDWRRGRPLEIHTTLNDYREQEIQEILPMEMEPVDEPPPVQDEP